MTETKLSNSVSKMLSVASDYCASMGISRSTLGRFIVNDGKFFDRIESGGGCTIDTHDKVMTWFKNHSPKKPKSKRTH